MTAFSCARVGRFSVRSVLAVVVALVLLGSFLSGNENDRGERLVTVKVALDEECRIEQAKPGLTKVIEEVSAYFEEEFAIRFSIVRWSEWQSRDSAAAIEELAPMLFKQVGKGDADIVLGVTCRSGLKGKYGLAFYEDGFVLMRMVDEPALLQRVLTHELAHLFGAVHVDNAGSLMDRLLRGSQVGEKNRAIIRLHRQRSFGAADFPVTGEVRQPLIGLYQEIAQENETLAVSKLPARERKELGEWLRGGDLSQEKRARIQQVFAKLEDVYIYLSRLYIEMKMYPAVITECRKALNIDPRLFEAYNLMGIASRRSGKIDQAIQYYRQALSINPGASRVYYNLGIAQAKKGDWQSAAASYLQSIELNPNFANVWNNLGYVLLEQGEIDEALEKFRQAVSLSPGYAIAHSNLGNALLKKGRTDEALAWVNKALLLNPELPGPHNVLGMIHNKQGDPDKAAQAYRRAVAIDPAYYKGWTNLGNIAFKKGDFIKAAEYFKKASDIKPGFTAALIGLGDCYTLLGKFDKARKAYEKSLEIDPQDGKTHNKLAVVYYYEKKYRESLEHLEEAERLGFPVNKEFKDELEKKLYRQRPKVSV